jgi:hypothetical protein
VGVKVGIGVTSTGVNVARRVSVKVALTLGITAVGVPVGAGVMIRPQLAANRAEIIIHRLDSFLIYYAHYIPTVPI